MATYPLQTEIVQRENLSIQIHRYNTYAIIRIHISPGYKYMELNKPQVPSLWLISELRSHRSRAVP